jgi:hypothetical protein
MKAKPEKSIEFYPDAMQRFERAVAVVTKSPPQHRVAKAMKAKKSSPKPPKNKSK